MTTPSVISADDVKAWCRIDADADTATIELLIATAQEAAALYTNRELTPETCPAGIKQAIAVFAADLFKNREGKREGKDCFYDLLDPFREGLL